MRWRPGRRRARPSSCTTSFRPRRACGASEEIGRSPKWEIALEEIDRVRAAEAEFGDVLTGGQVSVNQDEKNLVVSAPGTDRDKLDTTIRLEPDGGAEEIALRQPYERSLTVGRNAIAQSADGSGHEAAKAVDGDIHAAWASGSKEA